MAATGPLVRPSSRGLHPAHYIGRWHLLAGSWQDEGLGTGGRGWGLLGTPEEALLESGEAACLADEDISDLAHLDADEEDGVTGVLLVQTLTECLWARKRQRH